MNYKNLLYKLTKPYVVGQIADIIQEPSDDIKIFFRNISRQFSSDYFAYIDGGARGNPGPAGIGYVIKYPDNSKIVHRGSKYFSKMTNNQVEYLALIYCLRKCIELDISKIIVRSDSQLLTNQVNGLFHIKNKQLLQYFNEVQELLPKFDSFELMYVPRAENKEADILVNIAIDSNTQKHAK